MTGTTTERFPRWLPAVCAVLAATSGTHCDGTGKYKIYWKFADAEISSAKVCSTRGVEKIQISVLKAGSNRTVTSHTARCYPAFRRGPALDPGTYDLRVEGLGFDGRPLSNPQTGEPYALSFAYGVRVREAKVVTVEVTLTRPPACADGVDNDEDGLVDSLDPGCWLTGDKGYVVVDADGRHTYVPGDDDETDPPELPQAGTIALTWTVRGSTDGCADVGPTGAQWTTVSLNGAAEVMYPCTDGGATVAVTPGENHLEAWLADDQQRALSAALTRDASVLAGEQLPVHLEFSTATLLTDTLEFTLFWETASSGCQDASPMVSDHGVLLEDPITDATVTAQLMPYGTPVDGTEQSFTSCVHPPELLSIAPELPVGRYRLTVWGRQALGAVCWFSRFEDLTVGPGASDPFELTVERVDATGLCAP